MDVGVLVGGISCLSMCLYGIRVVSMQEALSALSCMFMAEEIWYQLFVGPLLDIEWRRLAGGLVESSVGYIRSR